MEWSKDLIGKDFYSKLIYNGKYLKIKIKSFNDAIKTDFQWSLTTKRKSFMQSSYNNTYWLLFKSDEDYYLKKVLKEYK